MVRALVTGLLVTAVVAVAAVAGVAQLRDRDAVAGSGGPSAYAHVLRLSDGDAGYAAVDTGSDVRVWWRDPGSDTWTGPSVVPSPWRGRLDWVNIRVAVETVALRLYYYAHGTRSSRFAICRGGACIASDSYAEVADPACTRGSCRLRGPQGKIETHAPELDATGQQAFFGVTEHGYAVWSQGHSLRDLAASGLPRRGVVGAPMMATDGSMRVVSGLPRANSCLLRLYVSAPVGTLDHDVRFRRVASTRAPSSTGDCATTLEGFAPDQALVHTDQPTPAYLVRTDGVWHPTREDPTGMIRYGVPVPHTAAGKVTRTGFWHWREVVVGSPDGHRLVAQVHFPGAATWTDPVTVGRAPRSWDCTRVTPTSEPASEPFYVSLECRSPSSPYVAVHAVTEDGTTWTSVRGTDSPTRVGDDLYFDGSPAHRWSAEGGLERVGLPVPANSRSIGLADGTTVLVTARPEGDRCRLVVRVAEPGAERWSDPLPDPTPLVPRREPCEPVGQPEGQVVYLYFARPGLRPGVVKQVDGTWQVTARRRDPLTQPSSSAHSGRA